LKGLNQIGLGMYRLYIRRIENYERKNPEKTIKVTIEKVWNLLL
jgi:hypothetical protein